jgi:FKBP-type peptidyl-prolyl cis-trans isomerase
MGIRFSHIQGELEIYRPDQEAGQAQLAAIQQAQRADHQTQRAKQAQEQAQQAQEQVRSMVVNLLRSGMSAEQIADIAGVSVDRVNEFC